MASGAQNTPKPRVPFILAASPLVAHTLKLNLGSTAEKGGIKNFDLNNKITSMQYSWVKRMFEDDFDDWKVIPLFSIGKHLGKNNIDINNDIPSNFHLFINIFS